MLNAIKRMFSGGSGGSWSGAREWAQARGHDFKPTREGDGFVVEAGTLQTGWRLEWGPSQRPYIQGQELRLRAETVEVELQMLILSRSLKDAMERAVFEQFTEGLQTRIDTATPEEMRWLVLFPKLKDSEMKILRDSYVALASSPVWLSGWIEGRLSEQLQQARSTWLQPEDPLALVYQRGRLTLRTPLAQPDAARLAEVMRLFETAAHEARRVASQCVEQGGPSTQPSGWQTPDDGASTR